MSGKKWTHVRWNGDLLWLRPNGKTQVTIEYVPQVMEEIVDVVRLIPQECFQQRTMEQIVHTPVQQVVEEISGSGPDHSPGAYLEACHRPNRRCASVDGNARYRPSRRIQKTAEVPQVQFLD